MSKKDMQDQIYNMLIREDKITWKSIIHELIKTEQIDPWNIDISLLSKKYRESIKHLQNANFFVSGKMLLASAVLLKMKSHKLLTEDISNFDSQLYAEEESSYEYESSEPFQEEKEDKIIKPELTIRTPLPRKRKVTLNDLMKALQKALEVNQRRVIRQQVQANIEIKIPEKKIDITDFITKIYNRIMDFFKTKKENLTFTKLVPTENREDKIYSIISLLHLDNQQKIMLNQKKHFGEIEIRILEEKPK